MPERIRVEGGHRLKGTVLVGGAKNAALPCVAAALLSPEPVTLHNVPEIADIETMFAVLEFLGASAERVAANSITVKAPEITGFSPPTDLVVKNRANFLIMGALLGRFGKAACSPPGGDVIGQRPVDVHLAGFSALGATIGREGEKFTAQTDRLTGTRIFLDYPSWLGTENLMMAACLARGHTTLVNAACEPEVECLGNLLNAMGARVRGAGQPVIEIDGVEELHGTEFTVIPDRFEAGTFAIAAGLTGGDVLIQGAAPRHMDAVIAKLREIGVLVEETESGLHARGEQDLSAASLQAFPYPGMPTDMQPPFAALLTQASGVSYIHERVFENRMLYVAELRKLGAEIITTGGTTAIVTGATQLVGTQVRALDIRAGAAVVLAALAATGYTEVRDIYHLDRGYERFEEKLTSLGAVIEREIVVS
ncbi:MAG: UDP-N-acetylglucosamine 1-carboxyvinyltransferase [Dehalococcoidia bacterium]|nr:UDP-N-acetylglucosamine 1-carboxyvinyltransferase [Dehalococcoidia bacterium]